MTDRWNEAIHRYVQVIGDPEHNTPTLATPSDVGSACTSGVQNRLIAPFKKRAVSCVCAACSARALMYTARATAPAKGSCTQWSDQLSAQHSFSVAASVPILSNYALSLCLRSVCKAHLHVGIPQHKLVLLWAASYYHQLEYPLLFPLPFPLLFPP